MNEPRSVVVRRVVVVSDIHMGPSDKSAFFRAGPELAAFVAGLARRPDPLDLVILGDALDYLQMEPYLAFTEKVALEKTRAIIAHNRGVFDALATFAAMKDKRIRWCIGNHDIELLFPSARRAIEATLFGEGKAPSTLVWELDDDKLDYLANGRRLRLVHGNKADRWNILDYPATRALAENGGDAGYVYPLGSRLVARVLNPLKDQGFGHVDLLKPEQSVALPLTLALWPEDTAKLLREAFPLLASASASQIAQMLAGLGGAAPVTFAPGEAAPADDAALLREALAAMGGGLGPGERADVAKLVLTGKAAPQQGGAVTFGIRAWVTSLLRQSGKAANEESDVFALDKPDDLHAVVLDTFAKSAAAGGEPIAVLIAGHTHLARSVSYLAGHYFNTGTWADLMRLPRFIADEDFEALASTLRDALRSPEQAPAALRPFRRLTYAELDLAPESGAPFRASLKEHAGDPTWATYP
ncbi:MAG: hypothetical protein HOW73_17075 [Polyangiaceae bacterium]|nr:hypothetical protein [Polyangiaceae bacterium]